MNWEPISDPPKNAVGRLLLWDGAQWVDGHYDEKNGFSVWEWETGETWHDPDVTHYLIITPPS